MTPGKMAAQAGHAFVEALRASGSHLDGATTEASDYQRYVADPPGTKVVLEAPDEIALLRLHDEAQQRGIPSALIFDSGHVLPPHFDGSSILTAVGFGPIPRGKARPITRRFALVP
jgi:PTH2 family peptidyl-tRNA hydrolase